MPQVAKEEDLVQPDYMIIYLLELKSYKLLYLLPFWNYFLNELLFAWMLKWYEKVCLLPKQILLPVQITEVSEKCLQVSNTLDLCEKTQVELLLILLIVYWYFKDLSTAFIVKCYAH